MEASNPYKGMQDIKEFAYPEQKQYEEFNVKSPKIPSPEELLKKFHEQPLIFIEKPVFQPLDLPAICDVYDVYTFKRYQEFACKTKKYPEKNAIIYPALGMAEETGEVCGKIKKWLRGDVPELDKNAMAKEIGDVLWYIASLADDLGLSMEDIARMNIDKVNKRMATGTLKGNGDNREEVKELQNQAGVHF